MQEPNGDVDLLYESLKAMNAKSDANEEERKGGSGRVGKMLVSPDQENTKVALVAYCPPAKQGVLTAEEWMKDMVKALGGGEILFSDSTTAKLEIKNDPDKGLFVLKLKDSAITESINYLKSKGLFPDAKDDDDSDYVSVMMISRQPRTKVVPKKRLQRKKKQPISMTTLSRCWAAWVKSRCTK
jgi:hypothetical protein